jgi:DNA-binding NarL/FixJ family response regulator
MTSDPVPASVSPSCLLLAERHQGLLEGIQGLLGAMFAAVVTVSNEASLVEGVRLLQPALVVLDLGLTTDGLKTLRRLRELRPEQKIILLSTHDARVAAEAALRAGTDGYVLKQSIAEDLLAAAEIVLAGGRYCSPRVDGVLAPAAPVVCSPPSEPLARATSDPNIES